jgi:hypothetical protein
MSWPDSGRVPPVEANRETKDTPLPIGEVAPNPGVRADPVVWRSPGDSRLIVGEGFFLLGR